MTDNVLQRVLEKCRNALISRIPIIYIKTDSDIFIRQLVLCENRPLVVLVSTGGRQGTEEEKKLKEKRPIYELSDLSEKSLAFCSNYRNELPKRDYRSGLYSELNLPMAPKDRIRGGQIKEIYRPCMWTYKMPEKSSTSEKYEEACKALEEYVLDHENPRHPQYEALQSCVVIIYSSQVELPAMLKTYTEIIEVGYPDEEEIRDIIKTESLGDPNLTENDEYLSALCTAFLGFTAEEVSMTMKKIMAISTLEDSGKAEAIISEQKKQKMQGGILEQCDPHGSIGGMDNYRKWLSDQVKPLKNSNQYMRRIGTPPPKGVLLCGIPGCGKSEAAKFTAMTLGLPLLKMDIGSLMDKYQGVSEQKMRDALKMAEAMSPCILWIDELEKGFSGAGTNGDSSSFKRMFGYMLGWMQDNRKPCFIFATANDIGGLPKEFFRSGRFDVLYAVYLPTASECISIFQACMNKVNENIAKARHLDRSDVQIFSAECFSEARIRRIINNNLVHPNGSPRIVVGSDIQKIVDMALRKLSDEEMITEGKWEQAIVDVISDPNFSTYGDGEENIDSIAVGYCRMLRKGFLPTSDHVLFNKSDYHRENIEQYERLRRISTAAMGEEELNEHHRKLKDCEILQDSGRRFDNAYDDAVYKYLRPRINEMALLVERYERDNMIR